LSTKTFGIWKQKGKDLNMGFWADFMSGKFYTYASWCGILSIVLLWIFCIWNLISANIPFALVGIAISIMMLFLEIPICTWCCSGPKTDKFQERFAKPLMRAALYLIFAVIMWLSLLICTSTLIIPACSLTVTAIFYSTAVFRKEDPVADKRQGQVAAVPVYYGNSGNSEQSRLV